MAVAGLMCQYKCSGLRQALMALLGIWLQDGRDEFCSFTCVLMNMTVNVLDYIAIRIIMGLEQPSLAANQ